MRVALLDSGKNMAAIFGDLLARAGGIFKPVYSEPPTQAEKDRRMAKQKVEEDMRPKARDLGKAHYYDRNHILRRASPKREKSMTARQWKKRNKAFRRQWKALAQAQ